MSIIQYMYMIYSLSLTTLTTGYSCYQIKEAHFEVLTNAKLHGSLLDTKTAKSKLECAVYCLKMETCYATNFSPLNNECQLLHQLTNSSWNTPGWIASYSDIPSCKEFKVVGKQSGYYTIYPKCGGLTSIRVYCDMESAGGVWLRLYYKAGANTCYKYDDITWTAELVHCFTKTSSVDIGVSDSTETLNREKSWIWSGITQLQSDGNAQLKMAYLANCLTPTGTVWSSSYAGGFLSFSSPVTTLGSWTNYYRGCGATGDSNNWYPVDGQQSNSLRFGGGTSHEAEFVNTGCNGYHVDEASYNTVASRWFSDNTRTIWLRGN